MANALLRWAGSKRKLVPVLRQHWGDCQGRYIEPFAGSACLFFALEPPAAIIGDINSDLIESYSIIRTNPDEVHRRLVRARSTSTNYYRVRNLDPTTLSPIERAVRFCFLNRYCFNGLYRTNTDGRFNVPYGGQKSGNPPTLRTFRAAADLLGRATLIAGGFEKVLNLEREGDFVYLDPPYRVSSRRVFREYDPSSFSKPDLERLCGWLEELECRQVHFLASYAESAEARLLAKGFYTRRVRLRRNIAGFTGSRRTASELLISNRPLSKNRSRRDPY